MFPIEAFRGTVERFIGILKSLGVRHHLTGGVVSVAWGEPSGFADMICSSASSTTVTTIDPVTSPSEIPGRHSSICSRPTPIEARRSLLRHVDLWNFEISGDT